MHAYEIAYELPTGEIKTVIAIAPNIDMAKHYTGETEGILVTILSATVLCEGTVILLQ